MAQLPISVQINLNGLRGELQRTLQRATYLVACGLQATEQITTEMLRLPDEALQTVYADYLKWNDEQAKAEFSEWVLLNGFREVIESVSGFLESAHRVMSLWSLAEDQATEIQITGAEWNDVVYAAGDRFQRLGLPDKLSHLAKEHGIETNETEERNILSVNAARNCLVHRGGVVSERDVNEDGALVLHWERLTVLLQNEDGETELVIGQFVENDSVLAVRHTEAEKRFRVGETVRINVKEFSDIAWSVFLFGERLVSQINEYGVRRGLLQTKQDELNK